MRRYWRVAGCAGLLLAGWSAFGRSSDRPPKISLPTHSTDTDLPVVEGEPRRGKSGAQIQQDAIKYHIKNLSDKDPEVRQTSAAILGQLQAAEAVPYLIEALRDEHILVQMYAHGALNRITGKNFGYKNYPEWKGWWETNKDEWARKKGKTGEDLREKVRAPASNTQGLLFYANGQYEEAYRLFLDAVNADPKTPDYRNNLGLAVMELARNNPLRYIDAMVYFQEAISLDDALPQPYMNIGSCFARLGKHIEAQHWFRQAIERDRQGKLWEHCWVLGKDLLERSDFHLAMEYLEQARNKAERAGKYDPRIYRDLALAYYGLNMYHSAYREIVNMRARGHEPHPEFVEKVRQALLAEGVDPDKEDFQARQEQRQDYGAPVAPAPPK